MPNDNFLAGHWAFYTKQEVPRSEAFKLMYLDGTVGKG